MPRVNNGRVAKPYERPKGPRPSDGMWQHDRAPIPDAVLNVNGGGSKGGAALNCKLMVSNLHYNITPNDLAAIFGQIGTLTREPVIKYDRSGRSTGVAFITYETPTEATRAKKQFNGILAKGQPMTVENDAGPPPRGPRRGGASSLADRLSKKPLLDRMDEKAKKPAAEGASTSSGPGPVRTNGNRGRGGKVKREPKKPKTAEDLDNELDAFMAADKPAEVTPAAAAPAATTADGDVDMAS